jgi:putative ABC transport system permease protein
MDQLVAASIARPRLYATLFVVFAAIAALLAAIGIYGVMAYAVSQSTREIGVRMALGAQRSEVLWLVLRRASGLSIAGIAIGLACASGVTRYLEGMIFGLTPVDLPTFAAVSLLFAFVAAVAAFVPARRATRVDPLVALRHE